MKTRIVTGAILAIVLGAATYIGGLTFEMLMLALTFIGIYELINMFSKKSKDYFGIIINAVFAIGLYISFFVMNITHINYVITLYLSLVFFTYVIRTNENLDRMLRIMLIGMYFVLGFHFMMELNDTYLVWLIYILSFGTDTCAYFSGVFLGKHKLSPKISPNKTIEGAIGGVIGATLLATLYFYLVGQPIKVNTFVFFAIVSIFSMFGDLFASKMKREYAIKDYGYIFPGHGGVMDRFDSLIFVAIAIHCFATLL